MLCALTVVYRIPDLPFGIGNPEACPLVCPSLEGVTLGPVDYETGITLPHAHATRLLRDLLAFSPSRKLQLLLLDRVREAAEDRVELETLVTEIEVKQAGYYRLWA